MIRGNNVRIDREKLAHACARCPFTLVCLSGKPFPYAYICGECEAIWLSELKTLVDCDAFLPHRILDYIAGCEACEPFEIPPKEITRIKGYQAKRVETPTTRPLHDSPED